MILIEILAVIFMATISACILTLLGYVVGVVKVNLKLYMAVGAAIAVSTLGCITVGLLTDGPELALGLLFAMFIVFLNGMTAKGALNEDTSEVPEVPKTSYQRWYRNRKLY